MKPQEPYETNRADEAVRMDTETFNFYAYAVSKLFYMSKKHSCISTEQLKNMSSQIDIITTSDILLDNSTEQRKNDKTD